MDEPTHLFAEAKGLQNTGRLAEAIALYQRAVELKPDYAEAYNNLGNALGETGRHDEAVASLRQAIALRPDLAAIHSNLGLALAKLKLFEEAVASHEIAIKLQPGFAAAHNNLGMALKELGQADEAVAGYEQAIKLKPDFAEAHFNLGNVLKELHRLGEAAASYRRSIDLNSGLSEAHFNLGQVLQMLGYGDDAVASFRHVIELRPDYAAGHTALANALRVIDRSQEALECYARATAIDPDDAEAHYSHGTLLREMGSLEEAQAAFDRALAIDPHAIKTRLYLAKIATDTPNDGTIAEMEAMLSDSARSAADRTALLFALGTAEDKLGRYDEAFAHFLAANRLHHASVDYDEAKFRAQLERIRRVFTRQMFQHWAGGGSDSDLPIFIFGAPRSGTTLVEQILASHPQIYGAGEWDYIGSLLDVVRVSSSPAARFPEFVPALTPEDLRRLGEAYVERLQGHAPTAQRITDKGLANYLYVGLIRLMLPKAKILHVVRNPMDACVSAFCLSFVRNAVGFSYELGELGRHYRLYREMMDHWNQVLPQGCMLDVRYEDLVENMEGQTRRILDYCGLPWDDRCLAFYDAERAVRTASLTQVRQPIYRSSIARWQRYRAHLGPLIEALGPYAPDVGS